MCRTCYLNFGLYSSLATYYKEIGDDENTRVFQEENLRLINENNNLLKTISNQLVFQLHEEKNKSKSNYNNIILGISSIIFLLILLLFYNQRKYKKEKKQYNRIIEKIRSSTPLNTKPTVRVSNQIESDQEIITETQIEKDDIEETQPLMSINTEEDILNNLEKLEQKLFFTKSNVSLSWLASRLNTNTKYLSFVINKHKGKDFNNYINELRISYIIQKLEKEPEYLQYKIAYLAEECGFTSHSRFSTIFKATTGLSPSIFISHMKKDAANIKKAVN